MKSNFTITLFLLAAIACLSQGCCPERFMQVGNRCYHYNSAKVDWHDARDACLGLGAHLVSIHSFDDSKDVYVLWKSFTDISLTNDIDEAYWIGLEDQQTEGLFEWSDGTPVDYTPWRSGEPNNDYRGEDCVSPRNEGSNDDDRQEWNDFPCELLKSYFCYKRL